MKEIDCGYDGSFTILSPRKYWKSSSNISFKIEDSFKVPPITNGNNNYHNYWSSYSTIVVEMNEGGEERNLILLRGRRVLYTGRAVV